MVFMEEFKHLKIQLEDIKAATDNFAESKVIGTGGFGKVYEGEVSHSKGQSMVAIKRLDRRYGQGDPEFWKEIMMLSRYTHQNLISLLGFCDEGGEKILVYEHASNGSLDRHLSSTGLTWAQRIKICLDAAKGVKYLHDHKGTQQRILHRDIKSSNILLDEYWNAKVSDMGLSKIGPANQQHTILFTNVVGTPGYCDPQYMMTYALTKESDIYSFGVVLFEVLCGRLCFEYSKRQLEVLVPTWKQSYKHKKLESIVFENLEKMHPSALEAFSDIAFRCLKKSRIKRPTISHVIEKLKSALEFQECHFHKLEYKQILKARVRPNTSTGERIMLLSSEVFLKGGQMIIRNEDLDELRELDSGTFGTLYQGLWKGTDVTIKRIKKIGFAYGSSEHERLTLEFWREAYILSKLHHPNVMAFYGVVQDGPDGTLATITEFMVNGSLRNVLMRKDRHLDRRRRLIIAMNAACGMEYVHSKNIVHFDLKCSNLLVNLKDPSRPICKVGGFELSKIKRNTFISGGTQGTLPWMAPEQLNGNVNKVSEKVDVFSFGIVLWEILTGEEPYANMHYGAIIGGIVNNTLRPTIPSYCDPEWRSLMERCWSRDPDVRPSFAEISKQLQEMCAGHKTLQELENIV